MKWIILLTFALNNIFIINISYSNDVKSPDDQKAEKYKNEAVEIYQSLGSAASIVSRDAFLSGYLGYKKYQSELPLPIITFINYAIGSSSPRLAIINLKEKAVIHISKVAHGRNSTEAAGQACPGSYKSTCIDGGPEIQMCNFVKNSSAIRFGGAGGSCTSPDGFILAKGTGDTGVGPNVLLYGLEEKNKNITTRLIKLHAGSYVEEDLGTSGGCVVVPKDDNFRPKFLNYLSGGSLIYIFRGTDIRPVSDDEIKHVASSTEDKELPPSPPSPVISKSEPKFEDTSLFKDAAPSIGAAEMGVTNASGKTGGGMSLGSMGAILGVGGIAAGAVLLSKSDTKLGEDSKKDSNSGGAQIDNSSTKSGPIYTGPLQGSAKYEGCQKLSDSSWAETTAYIKNGGNPADRFRGSWTELNQTIKVNGEDPATAVESAQKRTVEINKCAALAHVSENTDFTKTNINQPDKKSSKNGKINCVYAGAESQDYKPCVQTIAAHDSLLKQEADIHSRQVSDLQASDQAKLANVTGENAQQQSHNTFSAGQTNASGMITERADISSEKIDKLAALASKIPTVDSLYDNCKSKFEKHGTVGIDQYNEFSKAFLDNPKPFASEIDYCLSAVTEGTKLVNNQNAREEVKQVLKKFGREVDEYTSKSDALKNKINPESGQNEFSFGASLTDINLNSKAGGSYGRYDHEGIMLKNSGSSNSDRSFHGRGNNFSLLRAPVSIGNGLGASSIKGSVKDGVFQDENGGSGSNIALISKSGASFGSGIYNEEFERRINLALQHPEKLGELNLSPSEMHEYITRKDYNALMAKGANEGGARVPASSSIDIKDESSRSISSKEQNLFEIISGRYAKKFGSGL